MQVRSIAATAMAVASIAAGQAIGQPLGQEGGQTDVFVSTNSRAQVHAELVQFGIDYPVSPWATRYDQLANFKSTRRRADVTAAYIADRDEVAAFTGEDSGSVYLAQAGTHSAPASTAAFEAIASSRTKRRSQAV